MKNSTEGPTPVVPPPPQEALITTNSLFDGKQWVKDSFNYGSNAYRGKAKAPRRVGSRFSKEARAKKASCRLSQSVSMKEGKPSKPVTPWSRRAAPKATPKKK